MIEKKLVREKLVAYYSRLDKKMEALRKLDNEITVACNGNSTLERAWRESSDYRELHGKISMLFEVKSDILELLFDEDFND